MGGDYGTGAVVAWVSNDGRQWSRVSVGIIGPASDLRLVTLPGGFALLADAAGNGMLQQFVSTADVRASVWWTSEVEPTPGSPVFLQAAVDSKAGVLAFGFRGLVASVWRLALAPA